MAIIKQVWAREILDSRGIPTVETACQLDTGHVAVASVPAGTSNSTHEALELRDNDPQRFKGKGVLKAVENVNKTIAPAIAGMDPTRQVDIDTKMITLDGTENKSKLGANAILSVSIVVAKVAAISKQISLFNWINTLARGKGINVVPRVPTPVFNMINGGKHGAGNLDFQEFQLVPSSNKNFMEGLQIGVEIYMQLGEYLKKKGAIHSVGFEGGYAPNLFTNADALEVLVEATRETPYSLGRDMLLSLDVAANSFFTNGEYTIRDQTAPMNEFKLLQFYKEINDRYKLALLEDPFSEDSWESWQKITSTLGGQLVIMGDDLLATNPQRVEKAIKEKACSGILIKPNQIGTITETLSVVKMAKDANWKVEVSHRSGETNDWFIADFAVGIGADFAKFGAPARGERVAKYNRLHSIYNELGTR